MLNFIRKYGVFLIIPGIVLGFSFLLRLAAGPFWLATNFDPSYQYLVNGVYLIKGLVPNHTDHPGTPLQLLCCAVGWLYNMGRPTPDVVRNVLMSPEFYLRTVFILLSLFSFVTSVWLGVFVFRKTGERQAALLGQLPALSFLVMKSWETSEPVLPVVANVFPETMLIGVLNLFSICLLMNFWAKSPREESISAILWGMVCGLGVAVKITFIPILLIPALVLNWKNRTFMMGACVASFVLWTMPIISKYSKIEGWIKGILTHTGAYGSGTSGIIDIHSYWGNYKTIIVDQGLFLTVVLAASAFVLWQVITRKCDRGSFYILAIALGVLLQFSVVAKHPGAHYLLPGLGSISALFVLFYLQKQIHQVLGGKIVLIFILIYTLGGIGQANGYRLRSDNLTRDILAFHDETSTKYQNCVFIDYYRSSDPQAALFFGDGWNLSPHLGEDLYSLYPNKLYYHVWGHSIFDFKGRVWSNDILSQDPCVIFRGDGNFDFKEGPYDLRPLEKGRFESLQILKGTTEKQGAILMFGAMKFYQEGDYAKAMACVLQARHYHYQPEDSVESMIKLIGPNLHR